MNYLKSLMPKFRDYKWWLGIIFMSSIALASSYISQIYLVKKLGFSILTISIIIGIVFGNTLYKYFIQYTYTGVDYSKNLLLRLGIILYGFRITFQQIIQIGWQGVIIDILVVASVFVLGFYLGHRVFKLDKKTSALIGAGSSICGAAAVMATEPVVRAQPHKVSLAVATVVIFGTIAMFLYPAIYGPLGMNEVQYGVYTGSTVHEVAQVVAAGNAVGEVASANAIIVKMFRVMLLVPFLIILSSTFKFRRGGKRRSFLKSMPWFAILFIVASGINSLQIVSTSLIADIETASSFLLAMAMAALGIRTQAGAIKQAGIKPLVLSFILFVFLMSFGYILNKIFV